MAECKHSIDLGWRIGSRNCRRSAVKDGYCTRHHPDYTSPSEKAALDELERIESDPEYRAQKEVAEARRDFERALAAVTEAQHEQEAAWRHLVQAEQALTRIRYPSLFDEQQPNIIR